MLNSVTVSSISFLIVTIYAKSAPFITPCKWDDRECIRLSSQKAIPLVADGIEEFGTASLDPLELDNISFDEGGLKIDFSDVKIYGLKQCQMVDVERNLSENWLRFVIECPIDIKGNYVSSGKIIFIQTEGNGPFDIKSNKVSIAIKLNVNTVDNHWQFSNVEHSFDVIEKAKLNFENIFNGDEEKARPVLEVMDNKWKEIVQSVGKPIVAEAVKKVVPEIQKLVQQVPANELEL